MFSNELLLSRISYLLQLFWSTIQMMLGNLHLVKKLLCISFFATTVRIADLISPFSAAQRLFDHFGQTLENKNGRNMRTNDDFGVKDIKLVFDSYFKTVFVKISIIVITFNIARCIVNSICLMAGKLESHCTLQILNE